MSNYTLEEIVLSADSVRSPYYFNGRLLSAEDLAAEHAATLARDQSLASAAGAGVVRGLNVASIALSSTGTVTVSVSRGLALNRCGEIVALCEDITLVLQRPTTFTPGAASRRVFGPCGPAGPSTIPNRGGAFVLTIQPVAQKEGRAPVSGLGNAVAACNTGRLADGVQFRLVEVTGHGIPPGPQLRNRLAWYCLGIPGLTTGTFAPSPNGSSTPPTPALEDPAKLIHLADSEVPLALFHWNGPTDFDYFDVWAVRRRPTPPGPANGLGYLAGFARNTEIEAALLQFDAHLADILAEAGSHTALSATTRFQYLPPVGFLPLGSNRPAWATFFGPHATGTEIPLDAASVRSVVQAGIRREPWRVLSATEATANPGLVTPVNVYRVPSLPDYLLFARLGRDETTAAEVFFDNRQCHLDNAATVQDAIEALCRLQRNCCTLVVPPGAGWESVFDQIPTGHDAELCFQIGNYPLTRRVVIHGKGNLRLMGAGPGSHLIASGSETALLFQNCASVRVEALDATADTAAAATADASHLNGVLTFQDCPQVELDSLTLRCAAGTSRAASGMTVRNTLASGDAASRTSARIRHCRIDVGHEQVGILVANVARVQIEDNVIRADAAVTISQALTDSELTGRLRRHLIDNAVVGPAPSRMHRPTNATVTFNGQTVTFLTAPTLSNSTGNSWQTVINSLNPGNLTTPVLLLRHLRRLADILIRTGSLGGSIPAPAAAALAAVRATLVTPIAAAMSQGIVVGGQLAVEVRIVNNSINGAQQGIHIGQSHHETARGTPDSAGFVALQGNTIAVSLPNTGTRERHGIFVGSCRNLLVENNQLDLTRGSLMSDRRIEGVRVFGQLDRRAVLRANQFTGFTIGIRFEPRNRLTGSFLWMAADNLAVGAQQSVRLPTGLTGFRNNNNLP